MRKYVVASVIPALLTVAGCGTNPVTGDSECQIISEEQEVQVGSASYHRLVQAEGGSYNLDPELSKYVTRIGQSIAFKSDRPKLPYEFTIVNNSSPNAWSLPGGKIAINRGLLVELESEAELAAVLAHEIAHSSARHGAQSTERQLALQAGLKAIDKITGNNTVNAVAAVGAQLVQGKYSREAEHEADHYGMVYMSRAGYKPEAAVTLQEKFITLQDEQKASWLGGLFASHPPSQARVEANRKTLQELSNDGTVGSEDYKKMIASLLENREAYELLDKATASLAAGDSAKAVVLANEGIKLFPGEARFQWVLGCAKALQNDDAGAITYFDAAIALDRKFYDYYLQCAMSRLRTDDLKGARLDFEQSLRLLPTGEGHYQLAQLDLQEGQTQEAREHLQQVTTSDSPLAGTASVQLTKLELASDPAKYIRVKIGLDRNGFVDVFAHNVSPVPVRNISIGLDYSGDEDLRINRKVVKVEGTIPAGGISRATYTGIGPLDKEAARKSLHVEVVTALIAEQ